MSRTRAAWMIALLVVAGCTAGGTPGSAAAPGQPRDLITREQIDGMPVSSAWEVVQRLRPEFLRPRNPSSSVNRNLAVVYVDGMRRGQPETLRSIPANDVEEIRFVNAIDAQQRYGPDHTGGVIEIRVRRG